MAGVGNFKDLKRLFCNRYRFQFIHSERLFLNKPVYQFCGLYWIDLIGVEYFWSKLYYFLSILLCLDNYQNFCMHLIIIVNKNYKRS